jgi:hypothetical protein
MDLRLVVAVAVEVKPGQEVAVEQVAVELAQIAGLILLQELKIPVAVVVEVPTMALIEMERTVERVL